MNHNFEPIQNPLEQILLKYKINERLEKNRLFEQWDQVVGKTLARISSPQEYDSKTQTLKIKVSSDSWKKELAEQKSVLISKINQKLKTIHILKIVFV